MFFPSYRTKRNGVPILSKAEIDTIAERLILDFNPEAMQTPMEIDIDSFALNYLGLKQDFQYLSHNGIYLGMTVFNDTNKVPVYDPETNRAEYISAKARTVIIDNNLLEENQERRYRYTMGHEAGHDIFHRDYFTYSQYQHCLFDSMHEPLIQCRAVPVNGRTKPLSEWTDKDSMEWQSNYLSSALLMPRSMVKELVEALDLHHYFFGNDAYIQGVAKVFNVSCQAAEYRLKELGLINAVDSEASIMEFSMQL
jgi:Zn-dependent peptidase ImmA (M78 family)